MNITKEQADKVIALAINLQTYLGLLVRASTERDQAKEIVGIMRGLAEDAEPEFIKHSGDDDGWSEWVTPNHESYLMKCCDCGLVHEMEFSVVHFEPKPSLEFEFTDDENIRVAFKARRATSPQAVQTEAQEREAFEAWYGTTYWDAPEWEPERNCYKEFPIHMAWQSWRERAGRKG